MFGMCGVGMRLCQVAEHGHTELSRRAVRGALPRGQETVNPRTLADYKIMMMIVIDPLD